MSYKVLTKRIIEVSTVDQWDEARLEWALHEVYISEESDSCLCGHHPIREICILKNHTNGETVTVGNSCVRKFKGLDSNKIFGALKRVSKDICKPLNSETIMFSFEKGWICLWEKDFYLSTWRKRQPSHEQEKFRVKINEKIFGKI